MTTILAYLLVTAAIVIHEFGHFLAACSVGVGVREFSIGIGPKLFSKQFGHTLFAFRLIPLGGYISMKEIVETQVPELPRLKKALSEVGPLARIWIAAAGPLANIVFAFLALVGVNYSLDAGSYGFEYRVVQVEPHSWAARAAGAQVGDLLAQVNNKEELTPKELYRELYLINAPKVEFLPREGSALERGHTYYSFDGGEDPFPKPESTRHRIGALFGSFSFVGLRVAPKLVVKKADSFIAPAICAAASVVALFEIQGRSMGILLLDPLEISRRIGGLANSVADTNSIITTDPALWTKPAKASREIGNVESMEGNEPAKRGKEVYLPSLLASLVLIHLGLAAFNLLPFWPLDGGAILRALVEFIFRPFGPLVQRLTRRYALAICTLGGIYFVFILFCVLKNDFALLWS